MTERTVAIWRSGMLAASETFIRNHGAALSRWRPVFVGATTVESWLAAETDLIAFPDTASGRADYLRLRLTGRSARLRRLLTRVDPAIVHAHFGGDGWLVSESASRLRVPLVVTLHGYDVTRLPHTPGPRGARHRHNLRAMFRRAARIIAVSEFIRQKAIDLGADPAAVLVHHTGVPLPPAPTVGGATGGSAGGPQWDVVFVGRFVEKKGVDDLIEALGLLRDTRPRALIVGSGPLDAALRSRAATLGVDATFAGALEPAAVMRAMSASKILAAPSRTASDGDCEGLPTTILEAASVGVPTVSTWHSGIPEAVRHGETGLLCAEGDRDSLAANIDRLLTHDAERARLGAQARLLVERDFDLARQSRRLEAIYDDVVNV